MKALRTPDERFENLPGYPFAPHYTEVDDGDGGTLRIHHVDEGPRDGAIVLLMHGQPTWSYLYRHMIPILTGAGLRVVAPDLVGYGRSDKPAALSDYTYQRQVAWLTRWLVANDFRDVNFFGQDWGGLIGLRLVAENPERFVRAAAGNTGLPVPQDLSEERLARVRDFRENAPTPSLPEVMQALATAGPENFELAFAHWQKWCFETEDLPVGFMVAGTVDGRTLSPEEIAAYDAPFPSPEFKAGCRAMPSQVPLIPGDPEIKRANLSAWEALSKWEKPFLCVFTDNDPVTKGRDAEFRARIPGAKDQPHQTLQGGGHFLQEGRGEVLAKALVEFVGS